MTPIPAVDPRLSPEQAYHQEYGTPLRPAPGWKWDFAWTTSNCRSFDKTIRPGPCSGPSAMPHNRLRSRTSVEFIDENGSGPGVRLRKRHNKASR
jgi:hypothetical protein